MLEQEIVQEQPVEQEIITEQPEQQPEPIEEQSVPQQAKDKETNLRILREKSLKAERERDEALRLLQELRSQKDAIEEELSFNPEDLAEGKHLNKVAKKIKDLEKKLEHQQHTYRSNAVELQIKAQFPDFDKVVTADTIAALRDTDPELASSIDANQDLYAKAVTAYRQIKRYGIVDEALSNDKERVHQNATKPRPLTSVSPQRGDSPLSRANAFANGLTDDLKKALWKEIEDARKNG